MKRPTTPQSVPPRPALTAAAWALVIFATSCTVVFQDAFFRYIDRLLPNATARAGFAHLWIAAGFLVVKGYHMAEFGLLYLLLRRAAGGVSVPPRRTNAMAAGLALAWAALDEWHQTFVPGRGGTFRDVLMDAGGIAIAAVVTRSRGRCGWLSRRR